MNAEQGNMTEAAQESVAAAKPGKEWVGFSLQRVGTIAENTFIEAVRQKVYNVLIIFALVVIASASFFSQFTFGEQLKFVKDFCLGALSVFGTLIAIVGTALLLPNEVENRTIYTILAKPVRRFEFLLGKYMGSALLILVSLVLMTAMFGAALVFKEHRLVSDAVQQAASVPGVDAQHELQQQIQLIRADAYNPDLVKAVLLIFVKLALLSAITLLVSTLSTSMIFNVTVAFMVMIAGHLVGTAKEMWSDSALARWFLAILPDLGSFNVADDIILGNAIPWAHVGKVVLYGLVYLACVVAAAHFIFSDREI
jgi:ABC-type transport system involved in multi-copper enzyme maturation permease subunit